VAEGPFGAPRHAAQIGFCSCLPDRHLGGHEAMSDAALHAAADQLDADALRETIKQRVEAAETSFYWAMRLLPEDRRYGMYAVYAFCREVDDIADRGRPVEDNLPRPPAWPHT